MNRIKFLIKLAFLISTFFTFSSCYVFKAYKYRKFDLSALDHFEATPLAASSAPFHFEYDTTTQASLRNYLDSNLLYSQTYAFLVIRNDTVLYERYFDKITPTTPLPSFSVAKSFTGTLIVIALKEGFIKSLNEPVTAYLPQLKDNDRRFEQLTIQQVLDMRSGIKSSENYGNPFGDVLKMGFSKNVSKPVLRMKLEQDPGSFEYKSANTQLLALILEKATGKKLQDYLMEKLWMPLQMEYPATWNVDGHNTVRAFCCLNAAARDYAKFGRLYLKEGMWQGLQIIAKDWVQRSVSADTMWKYGGYKNQWWAKPERRTFTDSTAAKTYIRQQGNHSWFKTRTLKDGRSAFDTYSYTGAYHAEGILGQFVYVNPAKNLIIVRLGHNWSHPKYYAQGFIYKLGEEL